MRIVTIISGKRLGGTKQAFLDHTKMLFEAGFDVYPIIRRGSHLLSSCQKLDPLLASRLIQLRFYRSRLSWVRKHAIRTLRRAIEAVSPNVIVSHRQIDIPLIKAACPDVPVLAVAHGFNVTGMSDADYILPVSRAVKEYLQERGINVPMTVLPNAIRAGKEWGYRSPGKSIMLGTLAVFRRKKNLELLIDVCDRLNKAGVDCQCVIGGSGHRRFWLSYLIWKKGLSKKVHLLRWVTDKEAFFEYLDVYCVTSHSETFNISLLEAMARSVPVVATDCGGPSEIINSYEVGHLVPKKDPEAFVAAISSILSEPLSTEAATRAAYQRVLSVYDYSVIAPVLSQLCRSYDFSKKTQ